MRFHNFSVGSLKIDGYTYEHDVVIDRGEMRDRKKKPSKKFRDDYKNTSELLVSCPTRVKLGHLS